LKRNDIKYLIINALPYVSKPSRYIGGEVNSVKKRFKNVKVKIILAFPDIYEIGMSYFGFQILYNILNSENDILAERVYAPWIDMIEIMKKYKIPLFSLESKIPIKNFDIIGFTLQYELHYTTILKMLELSDLKVRSSERILSDPIIIAGGPCAFNPEPMADFIDLFLIGDGEEAFKSIAKFIGEKKLNNFSKKEILKELTNFKGVYVPEFYNKIYDNKGNFKIVPSGDNIPDKIETLIIPDLKRKYLPKKPILPSLKIIHERGIIEIMRGCTRGCRFCSAGYIYRPTREREINDVIKYVFDIIKKYGYEEISLLSLSASDYTNLKDLMVTIMEKISEFNVSFSFPSLRAGSFTENMAEFAKNIRKSGLTLAVETATERLRSVINKNINEESIKNSVTTAFENGWMLIKLYFMIGLPTETDEDIIEIANLIEKIIKIGKPYGKVRINLSVSPFVPKPFTPFQWSKQENIDEMNRKIALLRKILKEKWLGKYVNLKWRDPKVSHLECVLGRGDRKIGKVIYSAYKKGAVFEGWSEQFKFEIWKDSFAENNINSEDYVSEKSAEYPLPWDHISKGISKQFLLRELKKAYSCEFTDDCRDDKCFECGILGIKNCPINIKRDKNKAKFNLFPKNIKVSGDKKKSNRQNKKIRIRICYKKDGYARFFSHLDILSIFSRGIRQSGVKLYFTKGFNPHPKISSGPPLPTGYIGMNEYIDIFTEEEPNVSIFVKKLQKLMPEGIKIKTADVINNMEDSLSYSTVSAEYRVKIIHSFAKKERDKFNNLGKKNLLNETFLTKKNRTFNLGRYLEEIRYSPEKSEIYLRVRFLNGSTIKVEDILSCIFKKNREEFLSFTIVREKINLK